MLVLNHTLAGALTAVLVPAPLVPVVAFVSHFLLDMMPHSNGEEPPLSRAMKIQIGIDLVLSPFVFAFTIWLFPHQWFIVTVGVFFGVLPDTLWIFWRRWGPDWFQRFLDWAHWIQWGERSYGWIFDVFYALVFTFFLSIIAGRI